MEAIGKGLSAAHSAFACPRIRNLTVRISRLCYEPLSRSRIGRHCKTIEPPVLIRICISTYMTNRGSSRTSSFAITDKEEFRASHYNHHVNNFYAYTPHLEAASTRDTLVYSDTVRKQKKIIIIIYRRPKALRFSAHDRQAARLAARTASPRSQSTASQDKTTRADIYLLALCRRVYASQKNAPAYNTGDSRVPTSPRHTHRAHRGGRFRVTRL